MKRKDSDLEEFVRNSLIAMRGPEFAEEHINAILDILNNTTHSLRDVLSIYDTVITVNPYDVMCKLCTLRGKEFAKAHTREVTELLNEGCPTIEEALKIIDNADKRHEIRERMQAIYDHLDAINDILQAEETVDDARKVIEDTGDFIDPADFI